MAFILTEPGESKGILVFKHLEINFVNNLAPNLINKLKEKYLVGVYFGFYSKLKKDIEWADFYLAADNLIKDDEKLLKPRIPLNGFNFINSDEVSDNVFTEKKYDFLYIGNSQTRKNLYKYVVSLKILSEQNPDFKAVIINRLGDGLENKLYVTKVRNVLSQLSSSVRKNIVYIESMIDGDPLPKDFIKLLYKQSCFLVIPSRAEGAARVVAEASLNNIGVISYGGMLGGTNNHLNLDVDIIYDDFDSLPDVLNSALNKKDTVMNYLSPNKNYYLESSSKEKLILELVNLFGFCEVDLKSEIKDKNLYNAFSGHLNLLDSKFTNNRTDEIYSNIKMHNFVSSLTGKKVKVVAKIRCEISDAFLKFKKILEYPKAIVKLIVY